MFRAFRADFSRARPFCKPRHVRGRNAANYASFHTGASRAAANPLLNFVKFGIASSVAGTLGYLAYLNDLLPNVSRIPLEEVDEDSFDSKDDLVVLILGSKRYRDYPREQVERLREVLPPNVGLYYTVKLMLCKGLRKKYFPLLDLSSDTTLGEFGAELSSFFEPQSQDVSELNAEGVPEYVSYNNFRRQVGGRQPQVVEAASAERPVLVQMFEDSCFLCFLIRPFVNSVHRHLVESGSPIRIKRLNVERNDFPAGCPVTRATPTFVLFAGGEAGLKWDEFKPQEFVEKLSKVRRAHAQVAELSEASRRRLEELAERIPERFMLFGRLAHWLAESQALQELMIRAHAGDFELTSGEVGRAHAQDMYSRSLSVLMDVDMRRTDCLEENIESLRAEVESAEKDCIAIAEILGREIVQAEA